LLDQAPDPLAKDNLTKEIGRGVFFMRNLSFDEVSIEPNDKGKEVVLKRNLPT
jgi:hypothetical protein